jgi:DNA-binding winged helix-turn-helix (wHTH) protein/TolB-like protein
MKYRFGNFCFDARQRLLFREGDLVALPPKALDTLQALLERHGQVVEKAELMRLVWPDTVVEDVGLARNISLVRKALGDDSDEAPIIETIPKRGYRFVAPVEVVEGEAVERPAGLRGRRWRWWAWAAAAAAALGLLYFEFYVPSPFLPRGQAGVAVVPFECICPGMNGVGFIEGLNQALVAALTKAPGVQVVSPATVGRYRSAHIPMPMMGRLLGIDVLVEGVVQRTDGRLRTTVQLIDVRTGRLIWAETYDHPDQELALAQRAVSEAAVEAIRQRLTSDSH